MDWAENPSGHFPFQILRRMNPFRVKESREFIGGKVGSGRPWLEEHMKDLLTTGMWVQLPAVNLNAES